MFRIVSIRDNSVRVNSGLVSFDVLVENNEGKQYIIKPKNLYISDRDMPLLVRNVLRAYNNTVLKESNEHAAQKSCTS